MQKLEFEMTPDTHCTTLCKPVSTAGPIMRDTQLK